MKKTFVDVMLELPVDATLRDFLTTHSLPVPDGFAWDDTPETSQFLVEAVKVWPDIAARDRMTANLMASVQLGDAAGKQAMFEAAVADGAALHLSGDGDDRDRVEESIRKAGDEVRRPGAGGRAADSDRTARSGIAVGGVRCALLMRGQDMADRCLQ